MKSGNKFKTPLLLNDDLKTGDYGSTPIKVGTFLSLYRTVAYQGLNVSPFVDFEYPTASNQKLSRIAVLLITIDHYWTVAIHDPSLIT